MEQAVLSAEARDVRKGGTNALRRAGKIPAILYGQGQDAIGLTLDERSFTQTITKRGEKVIFALQMGNDRFDALLREIQIDPVSEKVLHLDFFRIDMNKEIETEVPLVCTGTAAGVIMGGVMDMQMRVVRVRCMPKDLPEQITVDVSSLNIGQALHVSDLAFPAGVVAVTEGGRAVVTITMPAKEEEARPGAAAAAEGAVPAEGAAPAEGVAAEGDQKDGDAKADAKAGDKKDAKKK